MVAGESMIETSGIWTVEIQGQRGAETAIAYRGNENARVARVTRFPIGWQVSATWENGEPPAHVRALARRMAKRLP